MNDFGTVIAVKDDYPVSEGHMLILTKKHTTDYFSINDRAYLVMEFINGRDLDKILEDTSNFFTEQQVITWAIELCGRVYIQRQFCATATARAFLSNQNHELGILG